MCVCVPIRFFIMYIQFITWWMEETVCPKQILVLDLQEGLWLGLKGDVTPVDLHHPVVVLLLQR